MPNSAKTSSSKSKISLETKSTSKTILATLGKLSSSSNPDKDQTRYLCHKLLRLINDQETSRKEITNKGSLEILLLTLESCSDQGTCLALISTLAEIAREGHTSVKRLISHDATRVLLHTLSYIGPSLDWRLLFATVNLLAKIGPKDRRFALRARLTGALPVILSAVRSSYNHHCHLKLLPSALSVLKLSVTNSSVNAGLLGRGGAVNALYRIVNTLTRKQPIPLKTCLSSLNLLIRQSKVNATKAVGLGMVERMLKMHQDYHKADCRYNRHVAIRKSILNVIKNIAALKIGRRSFSDSNGLLVLHNTCRDYLLSSNKLMDPLLNIAIVVIRRCQPKNSLPVLNSGCTFNFKLPGSVDQDQIEHDVFEFESEDDEFEEDTGDQQDAESSNKAKRRPSTTSVSTKSSAVSDASVKEPLPTKQNCRTSEDLKIYDIYFPELTEYPTEFQTPNQPTSSGETLKIPEHQRPSTTSDALQGSQLRLHTRDKRHNLSNLSTMSEDFRNMVIGSGQLPARSVSMENSVGRGTKFSQEVANNLLDFNSGSAGDELSNNLFYKAWKDDHFDLLHAQPQKYIEDIQKLASQTKSMKEEINKLSKADLLGNIPVNKTELQCNKKLIQRLIKSKVLDDLGRSLFPEKVFNQKVFDVFTSVNTPSYNKSNIHVQENGTVLTCDIQPSLYNNSTQNNNSTLHHKQFQIAENETSNSSEKLKSNGLVIDLDKVLINHGSNDCDTSSTTISDDTWPGLYLDGNATDAVVLNDKDDTKKKSIHELSPPLRFDSRFESGNLRSAVRVREYEYDLVLNSDCNCNIHHQWFYFEVADMKAGKPYRFNIINCEKKGSIANEGMQPVMFSVASARLGKPQWVRTGREVCYYRNHFLRKTSSAGGKSPTYFTLTFTVTFRFDDDICYLAYHYPYTYTKLQMDIDGMMSKANKSSMYVRKQNFCETLSGNPVPVLTITALPFYDENNSEKKAVQEMRSRPYIFLSARVHPGESNASWTMRGTLRLLLTPPPKVDGDQDLNEEERLLAAVADELRRSYIFKIVPMLNPDGVINGHHRCSLSGEDLNRMWFDPSVALYPTVYHTKGLLQYLHSIQKAPLVYCDYHGHSRKMNVFLYGCSHKESINAGESSTVVDGPNDAGYKTLPKLLNHFAAPFSLKNCSFVVEKPKVSTARVVVWKEIGVTRSYTMESTYCGCDQGMLRGKQIGTKDLEKMGSKFCEVLLHLKEKNRTRGLPVFDSDNEEDIDYDAETVDCKQKMEDTTSPGCPMNSDAELTPDEEDDLAPLINSYFYRGSVNSEFSFKIDPLFTSKEDLQFWRYDPNMIPDAPNLSGDVHQESSGFVDENLFDKASLDAGQDQYLKKNVSHLQHFGSSSDDNSEIFSRKVCPASGRLLYYSEEEEEEEFQVSTTAPRPFESGLVLRKAPKSSTLGNGNIFENLLSLPDETNKTDIKENNFPCNS